MPLKIILIITGIALLLLGGAWLFTGSGAFERHFTISGVYAIARPDGYDAICFADADSKNGGLSCLPCSAVNDCRKGGWK